MLNVVGSGMGGRMDVEQNTADMEPAPPTRPDATATSWWKSRSHTTPAGVDRGRSHRGGRPTGANSRDGGLRHVEAPQHGDEARRGGGLLHLHPAREIHHEELGHRSRGVVADIAVLWLVPDFGFAASARVGLRSNQKFVAEMTLRAGRVVWDLNGMSSREWNDAGR